MAASSERPDYYAALGVPKTAPQPVIKAAYRRLVGLHHPDRHPGDPKATTRLQILVQAYQVLGDPAARSAYDAGRLLDVPPIEPGTPVEELLGRVVDQLFGVRPNLPLDGRDISYRVSLQLAEVARGCRRTLELPEEVPCGRCDGRGFPLEHLPQTCERCAGAGELQRRRALRSVLEDCPDCAGRGYIVATPCKDCGGAGLVEQRRRLVIDVPAGVNDGERLLVRGAGGPGRHGGKAGDCYVVIDTEPHPTLHRDGTDVRLERPVNVFDAIAGSWISVPTVEGQRRVHLPPGTRDGTVLRMKELGIGPRNSGGARGDQLVTVRVEMPSSLDEAQAVEIRQVAGRLPEATFSATAAFEAAHGSTGSTEPEE